MKKAFKIVSILVGIIIVIIVLVLAYLKLAYPRSDPPERLSLTVNKQRLQRGRYLSNHVAGCISCHSIRDWTKFAAPVKPGTEEGGGDRIDESNGFPGTIVIKNITSFALANWSNGEVIRAITCGLTRENKALFPIMPYPDYNSLTREDVYSIVVYLKTLKPIKNHLPEADLKFPINFLVQTMPLKSYTPTENLRPSNSILYGKYLATIASCFGCHTQMKRGKYVGGMDYAGGREFKIHSGVVRSSNITPSVEFGIGRWTKEIFINRFKYFETDTTQNIGVGPHDFNTPMPWTRYAGMTKEDLGTIFEYLRTLKPVENKVQKWTPADVTK